MYICTCTHTHIHINYSTFNEQQWTGTRICAHVHNVLAKIRSLMDCNTFIHVKRQIQIYGKCTHLLYIQQPIIYTLL
uniref:Uncharacterized protein n=1 Tax=Octopus bimaculoides TaxID=37653 RepID=A0A0L8HVK6_OCTBM